MINRGTILTLALSVAMHGILLGVGNQAMQYRGATLEEPPIQAMLLPPPVEPARQIAQPMPVIPAKPVAKPAPRPPKPVSSPTALTTDKSGEAPPDPIDPIPPEVRAALAAAKSHTGQRARPGARSYRAKPARQCRNVLLRRLRDPRRGILFRVFLGQGKFQVGEADHQWSHDGAHYRMEVKVRTTGVAALVLHGLHYVQRSEGEIGAQGLKPLRFNTEQGGKPPESAEFDWSTGRVSIRRDGRERRAARCADRRPGRAQHLAPDRYRRLRQPATHDHGRKRQSRQSGATGSRGGRKPHTADRPPSIPRTSGRRAEDGSLTIDIWLARRYGMLPVRIRMTDDKGEVLDQQAIRLHLLPTDDDRQTDAAGTPPRIELKEEQEAFPTANLYAN